MDRKLRVAVYGVAFYNLLAMNNVYQTEVLKQRIRDEHHLLQNIRNSGKDSFLNVKMSEAELNNRRLIESEGAVGLYQIDTHYRYFT